MSDTAAFTSFAPGFEFLQGLVKNAGAALPGVGQWVAPTLNPEELDKRIQELRTVQFWLEQNAQMLGATIQALEVQKMTLTTLQTMNVQMGDLRDALTMRMPAAAAAAPVPAPPAPAVPPSAPPAAAAPAGEAEAQPAIDPMQWWGALTQQFSELAASALKERAAEASALVASAVPGAQPAKAAPTPGSKPAQKTASRRAGAAAAPAKKRAARKAPPRAPR
jgi:hypothetical protein